MRNEGLDEAHARMKTAGRNKNNLDMKITPSLWQSEEALKSLSLKVKEESEMLTSVQSLSRVRLFVTPWTAARQASLSVTNSRN